MNGDSIDFSRDSWIEYVEHQATSAAQNFTRDMRCYHQEHAESLRSVSDSDVIETFVNFFNDHFKHTQILGGSKKRERWKDGHAQFASVDDDSISDSSRTHASKKHGGMSRHFSLRKGKGFGLFKQKAHDNNTHNGASNAKAKRKLGRVREGVLSQLVGEDVNGKSKWEKVKLVLLESSGGYMLEFYNPPKVCVPCTNALLCSN